MVSSGKDNLNGAIIAAKQRRKDKNGVLRDYHECQKLLYNCYGSDYADSNFVWPSRATSPGDIVARQFQELFVGAGGAGAVSATSAPYLCHFSAGFSLGASLCDFNKHVFYSMGTQLLVTRCNESVLGGCQGSRCEMQRVVEGEVEKGGRAVTSWKRGSTCCAPTLWFPHYIHTK